MVQDLLSGQVNLGIATLGTSGPHLASGNLRALAVVGGTQRMAGLPDVPTMEEAGFPQPEYRQIGWIGMLAPAGVPAPVLARLEKETQAAVKSAAFLERLKAFGSTPIANTSAEFRREFEASAPVIERMVKASGAKVE